MPTYPNTSVAEMVGRVRMQRPDVSHPQCVAFLNDRMRQILDAQIYWADLLTASILPVPDEYTTGTVALTNGSTVVTGTSTAWTTNDKVNTTIAAAIDEIGYVEITPGSMSGITPDTLLYINDGSNPEIVAVVSTTASTFTARFTRTHDAGASCISSTLSGRQFRTGVGAPIFTVRAVTSGTSITLDMAWGGEAVSGSAYQIFKLYYTIDPMLKEILAIRDQQFGLPIRLHVPVTEINWRDPQRSASGPPQCIVDIGPNENGNPTFEIWPLQYSVRQLQVLCYKQWPDLAADTDRPPWFLNPTILIHGAIADALRFKKNAEDIFFNPQLADNYEQRFMMGVQDALNANQSKVQRDYQYDYSRMFGPLTGNMFLRMDYDVLEWNM